MFQKPAIDLLKKRSKIEGYKEAIGDLIHHPLFLGK